jgi:hypothetical protein
VNRYLFNIWFSSEDPVADIIQAKFTDFSTDDRDYPDVKGFIQKLAFPKPQTTIAAESIAKFRQSKEEKVAYLISLVLTYVHQIYLY